MRSVPEWVGRTDDSKIPDKVRVRVFEKHNGICYRSGAKIKPGDKWDLDHVIALANGGEHRENNLAPVLAERHKEKTREDRKVQSRGYKIRKHHLGLKKTKYRPMPGSKSSPWKRKMDGSWEKR